MANINEMAPNSGRYLKENSQAVNIVELLGEIVDALENIAGSNDYADLTNKPKINGVTLVGLMSSDELGLVRNSANRANDVTVSAIGDVSITAPGGAVKVSSYAMGANAGVLARTNDGTVVLDTALQTTVGNLVDQVGNIETVLNALV